MHRMCRECLLSSWRIASGGPCPICRRALTEKDLRVLPGMGRLWTDVEGNWKESSKVAQLLDCLEKIRRSGCGEKSIVFSQWTSFLDLLEIPLRARGVGFVRYDGKLSQKQREAVLREFSESRETPGLLKVDEDGVAVLTSHVDGSQIRFADDAVEASDGSVYFSDASDKFGLHNWYLDVLEARPRGRLLRYDPSEKTTSVVIGGLAFANGVALSAGEDFLVVCESWKFRCLRHWLKGEQKGQTDVFIENLPGAPDNINLAPDGSFWVALLQLSNRRLDVVHRWTTFKRVVAAFPKLVGLLLATDRSAMVANVPADGGRIARLLDDSEGKVMSFVTSAVEFEGHLYLGSLVTNFIGRLPVRGSDY